MGSKMDNPSFYQTSETPSDRKANDSREECRMLRGVQHLLPAELAEVLSRMPERLKDELEEIRIRERRPLEIGTSRGFWFLSPDGQPLGRPEGAYKPSSDVCRKMLERV